jgi:hypothetical protein
VPAALLAGNALAALPARPHRSPDRIGDLTPTGITASNANPRQLPSSERASASPPQPAAYDPTDHPIWQHAGKPARRSEPSISIRRHCARYRLDLRRPSVTTVGSTDCLWVELPGRPGSRVTTCMGGGRTGQPKRRLQRTALSAAVSAPLVADIVQGHSADRMLVCRLLH